MATVLIENGREIGGTIPKTIDYSFEEHIIGTWVDGSTLYEKTINFGELPNSTTKSIPSEISNLGMLVEMHGIAKHATASQVYLPGTNQVGLYFNGGNVIVAANSNMGTDYKESYVTLRYTKTN